MLWWKKWLSPLPRRDTTSSEVFAVAQPHEDTAHRDRRQQRTHDLLQRLGAANQPRRREVEDELIDVNLVIAHDVARRSRLLAAGGSGYTAVLADFAPRLRERGLDDQQIELLLVHNPRRLLAFGRSEGRG